jgi:tol-pal system protein YbgF
MKIQPSFTIRPLTTVVLFAAYWLSATLAWGANKEMVQLQTQVQQLQEQMSRMQQAFDERMGVMKNLVEHDTDAVNKVSAALANLQATLEKQQADSGGRTDQVSGQIQALNDTMDELKVRLTKLSKQLEDMQAAQQNLASQQAQSPAQTPPPQAPPPEVLYNNAIRDYNGAKNDIAAQEFSDYIKAYPNTELAGNSYFYLAEIQFRQGNYQQAVQNYDEVLQNFPGGNKAAAAQLKKGFALIELGQKNAGIQELRHVVQRYPRTNEAMQARERLQKLGVGVSTASKPSAGRPQ